MVSPEVIRKRLRLLEGYLQRLRRIQRENDRERFLGDSDQQALAEHYLRLAIEAIIDVGQHIIASSAWESAEDYAAVFQILAKHGVLPKELLVRLEGMAGFRNLLVHDYAEVDPVRVFDVVQTRLGDLEALARVYAREIGDLP